MFYRQKHNFIHVVGCLFIHEWKKNQENSKRYIKCDDKNDNVVTQLLFWFLSFSDLGVN